ncbi:LysR family transcriptional regulator [Secundilactobacillus kimchicus]|uniref:LysR family transcriptional regulator n=1 Tax=Secundilactobacillus kimchicus TaxID=528209 RepID=UPI0024A9C6B9|nr:LysR family transcriptional regulator [Secundilactobacillus kimchicus]
MELRLLRYFYTIAEELNISRAAEILHITQPTLSRQLRELEIELDTQLVDRTGRTLALTEAGHFLKSRAAEILTLTDATTEEFMGRKKNLFSGHVVIGCVEADNSDTLAMLLEDFVNDYPRVTFEIFSATSDLIIERLDRGLLDMAILLEPVNTAKYKTLALPRTETWGLLVGSDSYQASQEVITPEMLPGLPLMLSARPEVRQMLLDWAAVPAEKLNVVGNFNLSFNVIPLVAHDVAAALMIEGAVTGRTGDETVFVPLAPKMATECVLAWRRERPLSPVAAELIQYFKDAFGH